MSILRTDYDFYVSHMQKAKQRIKVDKQIIKLTCKMIKTKHLSKGEIEKLEELLNKYSDF